MSSRAYAAVSGTVFGLVGALHLMRVVNGWVVEVGPWSVPMIVSWLGTIVPAALCSWAFRLVSRKEA